MKTISLCQAEHSSHKLRSFDISVSGISKHLITSGYDGYIIIREMSNLAKALNTFMAHHRQERGTKTSILTANDIVISLGRNGSLIAFEIWYAMRFSN